MKNLITLSLAAFLLAACSDTTTSPNVNPNLAKSGGGGITVAGTLTNNNYYGPTQAAMLSKFHTSCGAQQFCH